MIGFVEWYLIIGVVLACVRSFIDGKNGEPPVYFVEFIAFVLLWLPVSIPKAFYVLGELFRKHYNQ